MDGLTSEIVQTPNYKETYKSMTSTDLKNHEIVNFTPYEKHFIIEAENSE